MTLNLISQFHSVRQNRDARAADHGDREARLDRYEERLAERERTVSQREKIQEQKETAAPSTPAASLLRDRTPAGDAATLAAQIIAAGCKRRGETADQPSLPEGLAGDIIRAGMKARGEVADDHEPSTEAERTAALIIDAGRRRRGEI